MKIGEPWPPFRVLCVDDNRDCADSAVLLLNVVGFEAKACYDGLSALSLNETFRPGLCLIDFNMAGMAGDELAILLRSGLGWRPLVLVAITALSDEQSRVRIEAAGFDLRLIKPVEPRKLLEIVDTLFKAAEATHNATGRTAVPGQSRAGD